MSAWRPVIAAILVVAGVTAVVVIARRQRQTAEPTRAERVSTPTPVPGLIVLYFVGDDGLLHREGREVPEVPASTPALVRLVLDELITGSREGRSSPFPWALTVQAVFVDKNGTVFVDLSPPPVEVVPAGSNTEVLLTYAVVNSITANCRGVERVQILFGGRQVETFGHLDLSRPLSPMADLVAP